MIVDNSLIIDRNNRTFTVQNDINPWEDVIISVNGIWSIYNEDIIRVNSRTVSLKDTVEIDLYDYDEDEFAIIYTTP